MHRIFCDQPESLLSEAQFGRLRDTLMRLWSRAYAESRAVVVKATSSAGRVAGALLASEPAARAIYLNLGAEPYLATLLAGRNSGIDLRGHGPVRIRQLQARIDAALRPLYALSVGELAAMSWLAETLNQREAVQRFPDRVMTLDFDRFLSDVEGAMAQVLRQFAVTAPTNYLSGLASNPVLTRYSKAAEFEYSPQIRAEALKESRYSNRDEIRKGLTWLENLAKAEPSVAQVMNAAV